ncbi:MAG: hypothetical protein HKM04_10590 [Legionellales bacterium]|nr:hypothetical protein [Legionellales bacterium]
MFKSIKKFFERFVERPVNVVFDKCVKKPAQLVFQHTIERPFNAIMNSWVKWPFLVGLILAAPAIVGPALFWAVGLPVGIASGFAVLSGVIVGLSGGLTIELHKRRRERLQYELLIREKRKSNIQISTECINSEAVITNSRLRVTKLTNQLKQLEAAVKRSQQENRRLAQDRDRYIAERDKTQAELDATRAALAVYEDGGSQTKGIFPPDAYTSCFYNLSHMQEIIKKMLQTSNNKVIESDGVLIVHHHDVAKISANVNLVLPPWHPDFDNQAILKSIQTVTSWQRKNITEYAKILCPVLIKRHWHTLELAIDSRHPKIINAFLHDPMGGGHLLPKLAESLSSILKLHYHPDITLLTPISPYCSERQSKADKISCGPIVIQEIHKRINGESLDRRIPYEFGASELVAKQARSSQSNGVKHLVASRHQLLSYDIRAKMKKILASEEVSPALRSF